MRKRIIMIAIIGLGVVVLVAIISAATSKVRQNHVQDISTTFVKEVLAGDTADSYRQLTPNTQGNESQDDWGTTVTKISTFFKGKSATLQSDSPAGSLRFVDYSITGKDGNYVFRLVLRQVNGAWLIQSFNSQIETS